MYTLLQFGAVGGVLRQIPPTMVTPIILASAATSNLLGGVRSQLVPDARREATLKYRHQDNSWDICTIAVFLQIVYIYIRLMIYFIANILFDHSFITS